MNFRLGIAWGSRMQNTEGARDEKTDWILEGEISLILTSRQSMVSGLNCSFVVIDIRTPTLSLAFP